MNSIFEAYSKFPRADCGYCGNPSCITALRRHCSGEMPLDKCLFFRTGAFDPGLIRGPAARDSPSKPGISYINPCPSDAKMVTVEVSLASGVHAKHGYYDMISLDRIFGRFIPSLKVSPSLGIARIEHDGRAIMAFKEGRMLIRRALSEEDAFLQLSRAMRQLWAAVN